MQAPFLITQLRKLYNDSMLKKIKKIVIPPSKILDVRTYPLIFLHTDPPKLFEHISCCYLDLNGENLW